MAWRPHENMVEGELDNSVPGKVTGWIRFAGMKEVVKLDLTGDFHRDIRGAKIRLSGVACDDEKAARHMEGFSPIQTGDAGDITAGLPPYDYVRGHCYIEWYSEQNGRVVLELEPEQVEVVGQPIPACESDPISREKQQGNMAKFLAGLTRDLNLPAERAICVGPTPQSQSAERSGKNDKARGMKLLTEEIRRRLPPLRSQDGLGGKAIAYVKFFTPDANWACYATEFDGEDSFFGLVEGFVKELGYFSLSEMQSARGPLGLAIERDLHWQPKRLEEIAPELFTPAKPAE